MSENVETVTASESEAAAKKPRAPRRVWTTGDIRTLKRVPGAFEVAMQAHASDPAFMEAVEDLNAEEGRGFLKEGEITCDFRRGVFVSLGALGAEKGSKVLVERTGEKTVQLTVL